MAADEDREEGEATSIASSSCWLVIGLCAGKYCCSDQPKVHTFINIERAVRGGSLALVRGSASFLFLPLPLFVLEVGDVHFFGTEAEEGSSVVLVPYHSASGVPETDRICVRRACQ